MTHASEPNIDCRKPFEFCGLVPHYCDCVELAPVRMRSLVEEAAALVFVVAAACAILGDSAVCSFVFCLSCVSCFLFSLPALFCLFCCCCFVFVCFVLDALLFSLLCAEFNLTDHHHLGVCWIAFCTMFVLQVASAEVERVSPAVLSPSPLSSRAAAGVDGVHPAAERFSAIEADAKAKVNRMCCSLLLLSFLCLFLFLFLFFHMSCAAFSAAASFIRTLFGKKISVKH